MIIHSYTYKIKTDIYVTRHLLIIHIVNSNHFEYHRKRYIRIIELLGNLIADH